MSWKLDDEAMTRKLPEKPLRVQTHRSLLYQWFVHSWRHSIPVRTASNPTVNYAQVAISLGGHATVLAKYQRGTFLFDPLFREFCSVARRTVGCGLSPSSLPPLDAILLSNLGIDHTHMPSLKMLNRGTPIIGPLGTKKKLAPHGFTTIIEMLPGREHHIGDVTIIACPTRLEGEPLPGLCYLLLGKPAILFCGQSGYFSGFRDIGTHYQPDVALLPISGYAPDSFRNRNMSPLDALFAFEDLRARLFIPICYGTFAFSYEKLSEPRSRLTRLVQERNLERHVMFLEPGESRIFVPSRVQTSPGFIVGDRKRKPVVMINAEQDGTPHTDRVPTPVFDE